MKQNAAFENILHDVHELETFLHGVIGPLAKQKLKPGEDIRPYIEKLGVKVPASLEGLPMTWGGDDADGAKGEQQTITLVRPGSPEALGFTIGCIKIRGVKICLECGWLYCRIVIKGRFLT
jgi:hypothetical protein